MYKYFLIIIFLTCAISVRAQFMPVEVNLDTAITNTVKTKAFYIKNPSSASINITAIRTLKSVFYTTNTPFTINPYDSALVTLSFKTIQNITYQDFFIFENNGLNSPIIYYVTATGKYPDVLYSFTQGLIDEALKTALKSFTTTGYVSLGYDNARDKMFETIDDYGGDTIECVYIGRKIYATNRTQAQNQNFNTEHTMPQSLFNQNEPMRSDLFHLYPTDEVPNNYRSNYQFGYAISNITYSNGGSKLGKDFENETVFEPRDVHKGNVARSLFYFVIRYQNYGGFLTAKQENVLRIWNNTDTVNLRERLRNSRIYTYQHNYNPFIDHPELADRIKSFSSTIPNISRPKISASPFNVSYDTIASNDTTSYYIALMNYGTGNLSITNATSSSTNFIIENYPSSIPQNRMIYMKVKFRPTATNQTYTGTITVVNADSNIVINLIGASSNQSSISIISTEIPSDFSLSQNYPNPFNPVTKINFSLPTKEKIVIKIFDMTGKEVANLIDGTLSAGYYSYSYNATGLPSGVYFYRLISNSYTNTKRMVVIK